MTISEKQWLSFVARLARTDTAAAEALRNYITFHDVDSVAGRRDLVRYAYGICTKYGEAAAELACQMYDAAAAASNANVPPAEPAETATFGEVAKAINGARKQSKNEDHTAAVGARLVKQAGLDTTLQNAHRDGAEFAWVPHGDSCGFCIMLASNGWQNAPKGAATRAAHVHANCDCTYAVRFDSRSGVEGYDPDYYKLRWDEAKEAAEDWDGGTGWQDALNALRREQYEENADKINAQKRIAYAKRMEAKKNTPTDVTAEYLKRAKPGEGKVVYEPGYVRKKHDAEISMADWMLKTLGGEIHLLPESTEEGQEMPDFNWNGKLWELKTLESSTYRKTDKRIQKANSQISPNRGGIILDYSKSELDLETALDYIQRSAKTRIRERTDIMAVKNGAFSVLRFHSIE